MGHWRLPLEQQHPPANVMFYNPSAMNADEDSELEEGETDMNVTAADAPAERMVVELSVYKVHNTGFSLDVDAGDEESELKIREEQEVDVPVGTDADVVDIGHAPHVHHMDHMDALVPVVGPIDAVPADQFDPADVPVQPTPLTIRGGDDIIVVLKALPKIRKQTHKIIVAMYHAMMASGLAVGDPFVTLCGQERVLHLPRNKNVRTRGLTKLAKSFSNWLHLNNGAAIEGFITKLGGNSANIKDMTEFSEVWAEIKSSAVVMYYSWSGTLSVSHAAMSAIGATALPEGTSELLELLDEQAPLVPDELTQYILRKAGQDVADPRIVRLVSLAGQRFLAEVIHDSLQICKSRLSATTKNKLRAAGFKDRRVLTPDDLAKALREFGINVNKPPYYVDTDKDGDAAAGDRQA
ncbi:hypothetical protein FOA52_014178 [Chlamydomonas sp. UWO 241]|nr:hypothetical protein FOA52_014178 [Chlamydomonas sp. UWO 241]